MRHGSIVTALVLSLALAGCKTDEFAENAHLAREASQEAFERSISRSPEVRECHNITGAIEYLLRVEAAALERFRVRLNRKWIP
jgi:DNA-binding Lrp family transcriptional regulator